MKRICLPLLLLILLNAVPLLLNATLWNYSAEGQIANESHVYTATGNIVIEDTLRLWHEPSPPATEIGSNQYCYLVPEYSFSLWTESSPQSICLFQGIDGRFYMERFDDRMGHLAWLLDHGSGQWDAWTGEGFCFYHSDWTPCDLYSEIDVLAPYIRLVKDCNMYWGPDIVSATADITLSRVAPVPESATLVRMGLGLVGLAGGSRKSRS